LVGYQDVHHFKKSETSSGIVISRADAPLSITSTPFSAKVSQRFAAITQGCLSKKNPDLMAYSRKAGLY